MTGMPVEVALHIPTILGEGPLWSAQEGVLYWLDIFKPAIHRFDPRTGKNEASPVPEPIYAMGLSRGGGFVAGLESGFATIDRSVRSLTYLCNPNSGDKVNFNDGKVDRRGRFWSGTMARDWESPIGRLYRLDGDGQARAMDDNIVLSNGLGWSPDDRRMYFTDFKKSTIFAYNFDADTGNIANRRPFIVFKDGDGFPDGMTVDAEGHLWVAHWDGWCVTRHDPDGTEVLRVTFPVPRPTAVAFGGNKLDTLYVTSATMHLTEKQLADAPLSGALFRLAAGVVGLPEPLFEGGAGPATARSCDS